MGPKLQTCKPYSPHIQDRSFLLMVGRARGGRFEHNLPSTRHSPISAVSRARGHVVVLRSWSWTDRTSIPSPARSAAEVRDVMSSLDSSRARSDSSARNPRRPPTSAARSRTRRNAGSAGKGRSAPSPAHRGRSRARVAASRASSAAPAVTVPRPRQRAVRVHASMCRQTSVTAAAAVRAVRSTSDAAGVGAPAHSVGAACVIRERPAVRLSTPVAASSAQDSSSTPSPVRMSCSAPPARHPAWRQPLPVAIRFSEVVRHGSAARAARCAPRRAPAAIDVI
jgi:hypothetical protein